MRTQSKYQILRKAKYMDALEEIADKNIEHLLSKTSTKDEAYRLAGEAEEQGIGDQDVLKYAVISTRKKHLPLSAHS